MSRAFPWVSFIVLTTGAFGQSSDTAPKFEIADVHVSPKSNNAFARTVPVRNGRYEVEKPRRCWT